MVSSGKRSALSGTIASAFDIKEYVRNILIQPMPLIKAQNAPSDRECHFLWTGGR